MHQHILKYLLLSSFYLMVACNKDTQAPVSPEISSVMIYNGSTAFLKKPGNIFIDTAFVTARNYNDIRGGSLGVLSNANYYWVAPGKHRIGFSDTSGQIKVSERYEVLDKNKWYTFYLADSIGYFSVLMSEENMADRPADKARIRLVNLSPDSGPVDFFIDKEKIEGLQDIAYKTITPFIEVEPAQNPSFRIKQDGAAEDVPQLVRKAFTMYPGRSYTFILRGYIQEQQGDPNSTIDLSAIQNF